MNTYKITFETCDHKIVTGKVVADDLEGAISVAKECYDMADLSAVVREPKSNKVTKENIVRDIKNLLRKEFAKEYGPSAYACDEYTLICMLDSCVITPDIQFLIDLLEK